MCLILEAKIGLVSEPFTQVYQTIVNCKTLCFEEREVREKKEQACDFK